MLLLRGRQVCSRPEEAVAVGLWRGVLRRTAQLRWLLLEREVVKARYEERVEGLLDLLPRVDLLGSARMGGLVFRSSWAFEGNGTMYFCCTRLLHLDVAVRNWSAVICHL